MGVLLAILISGVLLDANDQPLPKYDLVFTSADRKLIKVITDENGKFQVDLAPGTYRTHGQLLGSGNFILQYQFGLVTVDKNTSTLKLKEPPQEPVKIKVIDGTQRDFSLRPDERQRVILPQIFDKP